MENNDFSREMLEILRQKMDEAMDACAEQMAKEIAKGVFEEVEGGLTDPMTRERIPLIYMKVIEELQKHLEEMSGKVKITDE